MFNSIEFLTVTLIGALMIISPGPDFAIVLKNSLVHGRFSGVSAAFGVGIACLCHVAVNLMGIGFIISQSVIAFTVLKVLGAFYLIYIGVKGLKARKALHDSSNVSSNSSDSFKSNRLTSIQSNESSGRFFNGFSSGFLTNLLNPKACLFYLSFFSVIISPSTQLFLQIFYGVWLSILAIAWFSLISLFFTSPWMGEKLKNARHWIDRVTGGVLVVLGLKLLCSQME